MPIWTVQVSEGEDQRIEAGLLGTESGALVAMSEDGLLIRAWAAGEWRSVRQLTGAEAHPVNLPNAKDPVLVGLPRR